MEPCLICCDESTIPVELREIVLELRESHPANLLGPRGDLLIPGMSTCWNCCGRRVVSDNRTGEMGSRMTHERER
jgi:hypothetical protein